MNSEDTILLRKLMHMYEQGYISSKMYNDLLGKFKNGDGLKGNLLSKSDYNIEWYIKFMQQLNKTA
jgi:hypothetical protein